MSNNSNLFLYICKPIKDEYGRVIGKLASLALTPSGKYDAVFIEFNDGQFSKQPMENLKFDGAEITFISKFKSQAGNLCDQIPLIWRKDQALKDLSEKRKISPELYKELHNSFDGVLNTLKKDAKVLVEEAAVEIARCEEDLKTLSYAIVNLEIEHEIGQIDEGTYSSAFALLQENLKHASAEKSDIELAKNKISNILLGDSLPPLMKAKVSAEPITETPELPEPPVVVYVKEIGKAGI